ncbi:stemmadenine O-acetyltransferase-like [Lycium barbarum]|uniref:stemmadenine O-acetyltransferase-like n=1 Tax=Lycium barbarum TaxID=112863 RepID=UPI00293E8F23|nr:stemmadenine O-acetyltransferase-like [Lycium barbarum]
MEANKVEIILKEMIKPSSPTPSPLRIHKLSLLDQISPPVFIPLIFLYQHHNNINRATKLLKQSLSDALTRFYPLAGRLNNDNKYSIDCNDAGAEFIEAEVHGYNLSHVIQTPKMEDLREFLPRVLGNDDDVLLAGIAIGVCMSHKVGDGSSIVTFINVDISCISERAVSGGKSASSRSQVKDPTRMEALSAFVWKHFMKKDSKKMFVAVHAMNIRSRMNPTIPDNSFGNLWTAALAFPEMMASTNDDDLVYQLRNAIRNINSDYIKILQNGQDFLKHMGRLVEMFSKGEVEFCNFTSWCRFPVYEVDFGWGKPIWVCTTTFPYENMFIFVNTKCGEGIEAWVNMLEDDDDLI